MSDPEGRRDLADLVGERPERLFHVGRLDTDTEGLLLLTNDGDFAHRMAHPSFQVDKTYVAQVRGSVARVTVTRVLGGVELDDGPVRPSVFRVVSSHGGQSIVELVVHEGRNRIVRRLLDAVGHPVQQLTRTAIGPVRLDGLRTGEMRELTRDELGSLLDAVRL
jgi:23S rRNA pseudouridine2605 synthase